MDEISMVGRMLAEPQPRPDVVAEDRARLLASAAGGARTISRPPLKKAALRSALGLGLTGAAAALIVATLLPGAGPSREDQGPGATGEVRNVLLAAANVAESAPTDGTYWHVRTMFTTTWPRELGRGDNRYTVEHLSVNEEWSDRNGQTWRGHREWVKPKSPEDEAAWHRDGSPNEWCRESTELAEPFCLRTTPGTASLTRMVKDDSFIIADENELTFEQLQRLPAEPDALRDWAIHAVKNDLDDSASTDLVEYSLADVLAGLLVDVPVPPDVRAAAYRALADLPNVTSTGPTQDALGRAGTGILIDGGDIEGYYLPRGGRFEAGQLSRMLIIDPHTSHVLAHQASVDDSFDPSRSTLILEVGWTDEEPHKPAMP